MGAEQQSFALPEQKKKALMQSVDELLQAPLVSNRMLARVARKIVSVAPAVPIPPLFARAVYKSMMGYGDGLWDTLYPSREAMVAHMETFQLSLQGRQQGTWWKRQQALLIAGDASESAFGAYTPNEELQDAMHIPLSADQLRIMAENNFSSSEREILCVHNTVQVLIQHAPHLVEHRRLHHETDIQTGYYSVMGMKGNATIFPWVKSLRLMCAIHDIEIDVVGRPREDEHQQIADYWSKVKDDSAWELNPKAYAMLVSHPALSGRTPTRDVLASSVTTKVPGSFYSKYLDVGSKGVDAFVQPWASCPQTGSRHLAYIDGPFCRMGEIIRKIADDRVDCI